MTHPALIERITRSLAYMLRHQPDQFDLELDDYGYAELEEVVRALNERLGEPVDEADVENAVGSGDRQRYEFEGGKIRALYGHSISVLPGEPTKPPEALYLGISARDGERALRSGLRPGRRSFLHLALTEDDARETGRRLAHEYTILTVHALDAWEEGINFFDRKSLFLSDPIPVQFLEEGEVYEDGEPPMERREARAPRRRGGRDDDRERGPRGDSRGPRDDDDGPRRQERPRQHDRDRDRERDRERERDRDKERHRERRDRDDRRPRGRDERRSDERPPQRDRGERGGRGGDRPRRDDRERAPSRAPASSSSGAATPTYELKPTAPPQPEPNAAPFGSGIFEEASKARAPKPKPEPRPAPKPVERKPEPEERAPSSDNFGAGI